MSDEHAGKLDKLSDKAQEQLDRFFDDPAKVAKAQEKAEGLLAKHMGEGQAEEVVDNLTNVLRGFAHGNDKED